MSKQIDVLKLALEALEDRVSLMKWQIARDAVKEALAQPEQRSVSEHLEPVAWVSEIAEEAELMLEKPRFRAVALYTTPPQRTSRSDIKLLTDKQITDIARKHWGYAGMNTAELAFARAIEAAHGIKE